MRFDASAFFAAIDEQVDRAGDLDPVLRDGAALAHLAYEAADVPEDTGRLRAALTGGGEGTVEVVEDTVRVIVDVPYVAFVDVPDVTDALEEPFGQIVGRRLEGER